MDRITVDANGTELIYEGTIIIDDESGLIMSRTALIQPNGKRRDHKPVTIEVKPQHIISRG